MSSSRRCGSSESRACVSLWSCLLLFRLPTSSHSSTPSFACARASLFAAPKRADAWLNVLCQASGPIHCWRPDALSHVPLATTGRHSFDSDSWAGGPMWRLVIYGAILSQVWQHPAGMPMLSLLVAHAFAMGRPAPASPSSADSDAERAGLPEYKSTQTCTVAWCHGHEYYCVGCVVCPKRQHYLVDRAGWVVPRASASGITLV